MLVADWLLEQAGERLEEYTGLIADHLALALANEKVDAEAHDQIKMYAQQQNQCRRQYPDVRSVKSRKGYCR